MNAKTGKLTVKKGTKKGTYKVTVKVTDPGDANYAGAIPGPAAFLWYGRAFTPAAIQLAQGGAEVDRETKRGTACLRC